MVRGETRNHSEHILTYNVQMGTGTDFGLRSHLALVHARVSRLHVFDLQRPHARCVRVECLVAVVCDERESVHGEDVVVSHPDPGDGLIGQLSCLWGSGDCSEWDEESRFN